MKPPATASFPVFSDLSAGRRVVEEEADISQPALLTTMAENIHQMAQSDTPPTVEVPNTWPGLIVWAVTRFGIGILFAYGLWVVYNDQKATNEKVMTILQQHAVTDAELARTLGGLEMAISKIADESREAHRNMANSALPMSARK